MYKLLVPVITVASAFVLAGVTDRAGEATTSWSPGNDDMFSRLPRLRLLMLVPGDGPPDSSCWMTLSLMSYKKYGKYNSA